MAKVASRELRNDTRKVLERVESGEDITITVGGRDIAVLRPVPAKARWVSGPALLESLAASQADAGLTTELDELFPESTDDLDDL